MEAVPGGYVGQGGDNGMWNALIASQPRLWRSLPCGMHASVSVLRGLAISISERERGTPLCNLSTGRDWYFRERVRCANARSRFGAPRLTARARRPSR